MAHLKILYGIQATGNGHMSRARLLVPALRRAGADVTCIISGRDDMSGALDGGLFEPAMMRKGLTIATKNGKVDHLKTLFNTRAGTLLKDIRKLDLSPYDVIVTDFEPVSAWAAKRAGRDTVGIGNQYAFWYDIPAPKAPLSAGLVMKGMGVAGTKLGLCWDSFGQPLLPPMSEAMPSREADPAKIVVYMNFDDPRQVAAALEPFKSHRFFIYSGRVGAPEDRGNIALRPLSRQGFKDDLADCAGVICNSGFELPSEVLQMGKKLLVKPLAGQHEQVANAALLKRLGYADTMDGLDPAAIGQWLEKDTAVKIEYPDVAQAVAGWIAGGRKQSVKELSGDLWGRTKISACRVPRPR